MTFLVLSFFLIDLCHSKIVIIVKSIRNKNNWNFYASEVNASHFLSNDL